MADLERAVGLGAGLTTLATLWTGEQSPSLNAAGKAERKLRRKQRALARRKGGSRGRQKAKQRVRTLHTTVTKTRKTFVHRVTATLVKQSDLIAVEASNAKGLAQPRLAKSIQDTPWSILFQLLAYKAERAGIHFVRVDPKHTSQDRSRCGQRVAKPLSQRTHRRAPCRVMLDRDINASFNILPKAIVGLGQRNVRHRSQRAPRNIR